MSECTRRRGRRPCYTNHALEMMTLNPRMELIIAGRSMSPTLDVGDCVRVLRTSVAFAGDVVVLDCGGTNVCHRVVLTLRDGRRCVLVHVGDARGAGYGVAAEKNVVGVVEAVRRAGTERFAPLAARPAISAPRSVALLRYLTRKLATRLIG